MAKVSRNIPTAEVRRNIPIPLFSLNVSEDRSIGKIRGDTDEQSYEIFLRNVLRIFNSRYSLEIFRGNFTFRREISDDHSRRYVLGIPLFRGHTDDICRRNPGVFL
ncbi:hypothetical protein DY000_02009987 [Brassica cretica]|uniref:Uncharacterized protein n=1 Tax=Brassica cretica TaxID=69181 RepID=A0ABQ7CIJ0_BRACR|nr:hypothetical protein DY000_02009987 [Brassica cretica]